MATVVFVRSSLIWNLGRTSGNEDQVRWPITPEVVTPHASQLTSGLAQVLGLCPR